MPQLTLKITVSEEDYAQIEALGKPQHRTVTGQAEFMTEQWLPRELKRLAKTTHNGQFRAPAEERIS